MEGTLAEPPVDGGGGCGKEWLGGGGRYGSWVLKDAGIQGS